MVGPGCLLAHLRMFPNPCLPLLCEQFLSFSECQFIHYTVVKHQLCPSTIQGTGDRGFEKVLNHVKFSLPGNNQC